MLKLLTFLFTLHTAFAQFVISTDKSSYTASDTMEISWKVSSSTTLNLKDQDEGQVLLCTCNASSTFNCQNLKSELKTSDKSVSVPISDISSDFPSGYYMLQFATKNSKNPSQFALAYSQDWFQITGLTGSGKASKDTCSPPGNSDQNVPGTASTSIVSWTSYTLPSSLMTVSGYDIPYTWQKGATRTAPFQRTPGTKVTQSSTPSRRFPTSSYTPYSTYYFNKYLPKQTATPGPSSTAIQQENFVSTIATTPTGRRATRVMPTLSLPTSSASSSGKEKREAYPPLGRRRRWAD